MRGLTRGPTADIRSRRRPSSGASYRGAVSSNRNVPVLVIAPFISPRTQERLKVRGFAYADLTGNIRLALLELDCSLRQLAPLRTPNLSLESVD
jgi:hypothetical protein